MIYFTNDQDLWELTENVKSASMGFRFIVMKLVVEINNDISNHYKYGSSRFELHFMNKRVRQLNKMLKNYGFDVVVDIKYE